MILKRVIVFICLIWLGMILGISFLDDRAVLIIQGQTPEDSVLHAVYVVLEMMKAASLAVYGFRNVLSFRS